jgi:phage terminase large subunit
MATVGHNGGPALEVELPNNWSPRKDQLPLWRYLQDGGLRAVEIAHRRWGKDDIALHWTCCAAHQRVGNYWHMLPKAAQARKAIWTAINPRTGKRRIDEAFPKSLRKKTLDREMMIEFKNGSTWQVLGSDNYDMLVGSPPVGIIFSEWALASPAAWAMLRPILDENGGYVIFITTPRGRNHALKSLELARTKKATWFGEVVTAYKSGVFTQAKLDEIKEELEKEYGQEDGEALFEQEYLCSFNAQLLGAYYAKTLSTAEREGRIKPFIAHDPDYPVQTAWDLGLSDDTAVWFFQVIQREVRILGYYAASGRLFDHYAKMLDTFAETMGWDYYFDDPRDAYHWVPWDAKPKTLASKGKSLLEIAWEDHGLRLRVSKNLSVQDGIQATRKMLSKAWISEKLSHEGLEAARNYQREYDEDKQMYKPTPLHNWASHGADALRILGLNANAVEGRKDKEKKKNKYVNEMSFQELIDKSQRSSQLSEGYIE